MHPKTTILPFAAFFAVVFSIIVYSAIAETGTFDILSQQQQIVTVNLNSGDKISGTVVVNGEGAIDFWISDPQNNNATAPTSVGQRTFSFTAESSGTFSLHLYNKEASSVSVTLNYNVSRQIFGMPQEIFLLIVIVGVILLLIIIWALLSKA